MICIMKLFFLGIQVYRGLFSNRSKRFNMSASTIGPSALEMLIDLFLGSFETMKDKSPLLRFSISLFVISLHSGIWLPSQTIAMFFLSQIIHPKGTRYTTCTCFLSLHLKKCAHIICEIDQTN